jgi:uncharacterized protein YggE
LAPTFEEKTMTHQDRHETVGTLKLSGEGIVSTRPDVAELDVGVATEAKTAGEAVRANAQRMTEVIAQIKGLGIQSESLQTTGINLSAVYDYDEKSPTKGQIIGYRVEDTLRVRSDVELAGSVLDVAVSAGANIASGVRFTVRDDHKLREQALAAAVKAADRSATIVAQALGARLEPPHQIEITSAASSPVIRSSKSVEMSTPVEAGSISIRASVQVERRYRVE